MKQCSSAMHSVQILFEISLSTMNPTDLIKISIGTPSIINTILTHSLVIVSTHLPLVPSVNRVSNGSDNGSSPIRRQAMI